MNEDILSLNEITDLDPAELSRDTLGFIVDSYFNDTPFLKGKHIENESLNKVNNNVLQWTGTFKEAFGIQQVKMSLWIIDKPNQEDHDRYFIARFSDIAGNAISILPVLSKLLGLDADNKLSIASFSPNESEQVSPHHLAFDDAINTYIWFSSHKLSASQVSLIFSALEVTDLPKELEIGFQWENNINFNPGHGLAHWFKNDLFEKLTITSIYRRRVRADELELRISLSEDQTSVNPPQEDGSELEKYESGIGLKVNYVSVFFGQTGDQLSFNGFGVKGALHIEYHGKELEPIGFGGRINTQTGILNLRADNFPTIEKLGSVFIREKDNKPTFEIPNFGIDQLRVNHLELQIDIFKFDAKRASLVLDAHPPIKLNDHLSFYPKLTASIKNPLNSEEREVNWQLEGWVEAFDAFFSASYSSENELFHLSLNNGELSSDVLMKAMKFPEMRFPEMKDGEMKGVDIRIIDLEFTAEHTNNNWMYSGGITISNNWKWQLFDNGFKMELVGIHGEFQYEKELTHLVLGGQFIIGNLVLDASVRYESNEGFYLQAIMDDIEVPVDKFPVHLGLESYLKDDNQETIEKVQAALDLPAITINQLMVECFFPEDKTTSKALSFVTAVTLDHDALPIPLDSVFLQLDWSDTLKWSAMVHFTFEHTFEDETKGSTELFLRSEKTDEELSFSGSIVHLHIDDLVQFFADRFGVTYAAPEFLKGMLLEKVEISLTKTNSDWKFTFECDTEIITEHATEHQEEKSIATHLIFTVEKHVNPESKEKEYQVELEGHLHIPINEKKTLEFGLHFHHDKEKDWLLASYQGQVEIPVSQLLESWLHSKWPELSLKISSACIFIQSKKSSSAENAETKKRERSIFLGLEMAADVQLNEMSFLKTILTDDLTAGIEQFRIAYTSSDMDKKTLGLLSTDFKKSLEKAGIEILPIPQSEENQALGKGFHLSGKLKLGKEFERPFSVGPEALDEESNKEENNKKEGESNKILLATAPTSTSSNESGLIGKWFKVEKTLGPITIARIGIQYDYQKQDLWILLDAGLQIAILEVSVDGLGIGSPLSDFHPKLSLSGMGIDFHKGALSIGGAIHYTPEVIDPPKPFSIDGRLSLGFNDLSIALLASYTTDKKGAPSFLAYGVLDFPIGGPPFFFVDGLAAGVGIHRKIEYPPIEAIAEFPLVSLALKSAGSKAGEKSALSKLNESIEVAHGEYFFAAGIRFNTFKIINSFVLLILGVGKEVELDLLGYSILTAPLPLEDKKIDPIAQARLMLHAAFRPDAGTLKVEARLDPKESFLVARACKLQGGFAFYAWFGAMHAAENEGKAGDFVLTLGGYHPNFIIPAHYPQVPRLGFHWQVDAHMLFKGELYFAMTPNALMTGGLLEGNWKQAHLEASFRLALNLLMQWQPFHYEGDFALSMRVSYHDGFFQVDIEFSTIIYIWGPEFGGTAYLKILLLELEVDFGAAKRAKPEKLTWKDFATAFLNPIKDEREAVPEAISCRITQGLIPTEDDFPEKVESGAFELMIESMIPITSTESNGIFTQTSKEQEKKLNITPMQRSDIDSALYISIRYVAAPEQDGVAESFQLIPVLKNAPAALWGKKKTDINADATVDNCLFGYRMQVNPGLFLRNNGTIIYPSAKLDIPTIQHEVGIYSNKEKGFEWLGTNQIDQLGVNYESTETSHLLRAFGLEQNLKASLVNSPTVDFLRPFEIETL